MTSKSPTPQAISALLKRAGFKRAEDLPGGFNTEGYRVIRNRLNDGIVLVNWWEHSDRDTDRATQAVMLGRYSAAITEAGYTAQLRKDKFGRPDYLTVTSGKAG